MIGAFAAGRSYHGTTLIGEDGSLACGLPSWAPVLRYFGKNCSINSASALC